ncbi:hypothetical protein [Acinetobacter bereziniae]|uniref:hypothetical protein n=1 Tax=Acinetobacter bereziniae TaxID=106648 RepID=UPI0018FFE610|nr:hypothetical protein [Acinetobacter bereziniae]MBJ8474350.1 hypothetical protein [Acinetobacter bereziniae]
MTTNPYERISKNICQFNDVIKTEPNVIFLTMNFYRELRHSDPNLYLDYFREEKTLFGMEFYILRDSELEGLDFQLFKSEHLNSLVERFNRDSRWQTYDLEIYVPKFSSWENSYISNGSPAPTVADTDPLKRTKIIVPNAVLKTWAKK